MSEEKMDVGQSGQSKRNRIPWVEKYRPVTFDDIVGNEEAVQRLGVLSVKGNVPNVILCGPPGVGKTTTIQCLARTLLGSAYKDGVLELNASNERGIDTVRNKIKMFAQTKVSLADGKHKIIILDEFDSMTEGAQQALRRTMEIYSKTTRFALACNTSEKVIEPIQSRCAVVRFTRLNDEEIRNKVQHICSAENVEHDDTGLEALVFTAQGDMRQAINNLQSTYDGFCFVNSDNVYKVCDEPHPLLVEQMLKHCIDGKFTEANKVMTDLYRAGYSSEDIVTSVFRVTKKMDMMEYLQLEFVKEIGLSHIRIGNGVNSLLQLSSLVARLCQKTIASH